MLCATQARGATKTLRVCDDVVAPLTLSPLKEFSEKNHTIIQQIFDSLVRFDSEGRIQPDLASHWRRVGDLTMEFTLKPGIRFHNGESFDAESVRYSVQRFIDPASGFPGAGLLSSISSATVVDAHTVRVHTKFPDGILLHRLAGLFSVIPSGYLREHGEQYFQEHPVGTGAFRFIGTGEKKDRVVLEAYPDYHGGRGGFELLEFYFIPQDKQVEALLAGKVDIVTELPGTQTLRVMKSDKAKVVKRETFYTIGSSINVSTGPLADKRVRQAINHAIDREKLVRYDILGNGRPLASLTMPGEVGHDPDLRPYPYDPEKARALLDEAGYPDGLRLKVVVKEQGLRTMKIISRQLEKVGIHLDLRATSDASVIRDIQSGSWDFTFGACSDPFSHSFFIQFIFLSSMSPYSVLRDPTFDRLHGEMIATLDPQKQHEAGMRLDRYIHDEALSIFTYQRIKTYGVNKAVDFVPTITGLPDFHLSSPARR